MCTKTKNVYGCGHAAKIFEHCGIRGCTDLAKYKMPPKDSDCNKCKLAGDSVTRGIEGRGRYAREIERSRQSSSDSFASSSPGTPNLSVSPWMAIASDPTQPQEKIWKGPTRMKADDAWVIEHERRISDLDDKTSKISLSSSIERRRGMDRRMSPHSSYEHIDDAIFEEPEDLGLQIPRQKAIKMLPYELSDESEIAQSFQRSHKTSYDSDHSTSLYKSIAIPKTPRRRTTFVPAISEHDLYEPQHPKAIPRSRRIGPKTEPYRRQPQSCFFDSPVSGSPMTSGHWEGRYEYVHPPQMLEHYHSRTHPVY